jgi:hypothetical protein
MKFKPNIKSSTSFKKLKEYSFDDIPKEVKQRALKYKFETPLYYFGDLDYMLYADEGILYIKAFTSFTTFKEIREP